MECGGSHFKDKSKTIVALFTEDSADSPNGVPENLPIFGERKNDGNLNEPSEFFVVSPFWRGSNLLRSTLLWADSSEIRFIRFLRACEQGAIKLFFVAVVIVYADEGACEGEYLAKGNQYAMVNLPQWRAAESRDQQYPTKPAQIYC